MLVVPVPEPDLFKVCPEWKSQQKILWAEVKKETGRWKDWWKIQDLLADGRCSRAVLDFLSSTDVGRRGPAEKEALSEVSESELREWEEEQTAGERGAGKDLHCSSPRRTPWGRLAQCRSGWWFFPFVHFLFRSRSFSFPFLCNLLGVLLFFLRTGRGGGQRGRLQRAATARTADRKRTVRNLATI